MSSPATAPPQKYYNAWGGERRVPYQNKGYNQQQYRSEAGGDYRRDTETRINSVGYNSRSNQMRRVNAAQGMDISQKYDAFGNNSFSSADNPWAAFFGAPSHPWKTTSYDKYDRHNYNLPEAYVGKNEQLAQTIDELIYTDETFYTSVLLPFNFTDNLSVTWDKWEFNEHFTGIVPEQGVSRLVSSKRESRTESFLRRGLSAIFEHGFMSTPEGRANYFLTLAQIARAVQETTNFGVIYAYLTCQNYNKVWEERHGYFRKSTLREILERENFMWAIAVKKEFGMEKLDSQIVEWMNRYRTTADTWILPPKPATYLRLVPAEKVYHYLAGPEGPDRVNNIVGAGRPHESNAPGKRLHDIVEPYAVFKKNKVYLTRTYHVDRTGPIDLMTRVSSVGEYFKIVNSPNGCDYLNGYKSCDMDTRIYDEDNDCGFTVSQLDGIENCQLFNEDGTPRTIPNACGTADIEDLKRCFFIRPYVNENGVECCDQQVTYMGDIDPQFFPATGAANLARTAVGSVLPDAAERRAVIAALEKGMQRVRQMAMMPITAAGGVVVSSDKDFIASIAGRTTWAGLAQIAGANVAALDNTNARIVRDIADFIGAVDLVAERLAGVMGGANNIFLNPANALPLAGYGAATHSRVLYENLLNFRAVPVYTVKDAAVIGDVATVPLQTVFDLALAGVLDKTKDASLLKERKVSDAEIDAFRAKYVGVPKTEALFTQLLDDMVRNPRFTRAKDFNELKAWTEKLASRYAKAKSKALGTQGATGQKFKDAVPTLLAVYPENPSLVDGSARTANLFPASRFDVKQPADVYGITDSDGKRPTLVGEQYSFVETPIMKALLGSSGIGASQQQHQQQFMQQQQQGFGGGGGGSLDEYFEDDYYGGGESNIGMMMDYDPAAREKASRFIPQVGGQLRAEPPNIRFGTMAYNLDMLGKQAIDPLLKIVASLYYGALWNKETLENFYYQNIMIPFNIIGARIGLYDMALGIKCKAGGETGYTYFGHSDFMLADDAAIKVHYGHYTHYGKSVVHSPDKVFIAYDIFPNRALGGMGTLPYTDRDQYDAVDQVFLRDIFYIAVAYTDRNFSKVMSLAGRFYTYMDAGMLDGDDPQARELHYSTAAYYNRFWGWYNQEEVPIELDEPMYRMNNPGICLNIWQGAQGTRSGPEKFTKNIIRNKSPWGTTAEGCRAARNGQMERIPEVPYGVLGF